MFQQAEQSCVRKEEEACVHVSISDNPVNKLTQSEIHYVH